MLMHHSDTRIQRSARIARRQGLAEHLNRSAVSSIAAEQDIHQRRFACAVFTQQRHDLSTAQGQADRVIRDQLAKALGDGVKA